MKPSSTRDGSRRSAGKSTVSTTILVLAACNLFFLLTNLKPQPPIPVDAPPEGTGHQMGLEPISFIASRLSVVAMAYLSAVVYVGKHPTLEELSSRMQRTWRRPAVTLMYIELFATAVASLLLALATFARAVEGAAQGALLVSGSIALLSYLGPALSPYSDIACKLGLVVSVVEEGSEGMEALKRAGELVQGMKLQGLVLTTVLTVVEQAPFMVFGPEKGGNWSATSLILIGPMNLVMKFFTYLGYTMFYHECKKRECKRPTRNVTHSPSQTNSCYHLCFFLLETRSKCSAQQFPSGL